MLLNILFKKFRSKWPARQTKNHMRRKNDSAGRRCERCATRAVNILPAVARVNRRFRKSNFFNKKW